MSRLRNPRLLTLAVATAVAVAFADSSIVVLALPDLYGAFDTTIVGVSWVITSYNLVVAVCAFLLVPVVRRVDAGKLSLVGLLLFCAASVACAAAWSLEALIAARCLQGAGAALLLAGTLALLSALTGSRARGLRSGRRQGRSARRSGPCSAACSRSCSTGARSSSSRRPSLWPRSWPRSSRTRIRRSGRRGGAAARCEPRARLPLRRARRGAVPGRAAGDRRLGPVADRRRGGRERAAARRARRASARGRALDAARCRRRSGTARGGLAALALLPSASRGLAAAGLALCGAGLGLAVPVLTGRAVQPDDGLVHDGTITIGARHAGLVVALALVAPLLSHSLEEGRTNAILGATKVALDSDAPIRQKVPIALDLRDALQATPKGELPDIAEPFDRRGAAHDDRLRRVRDSLVSTLEGRDHTQLPLVVPALGGAGAAGAGADLLPRPDAA